MSGRRGGLDRLLNLTGLDLNRGCGFRECEWRRRHHCSQRLLWRKVADRAAQDQLLRTSLNIRRCVDQLSAGFARDPAEEICQRLIIDVEYRRNLRRPLPAFILRRNRRASNDAFARNDQLLAG